MITANNNTATIAARRIMLRLLAVNPPDPEEAGVVADACANARGMGLHSVRIKIHEMNVNINNAVRASIGNL